MQLIKDGVIGDPYYAQANYWEAIAKHVLLFIKLTNPNIIGRIMMKGLYQVGSMILRK